MLHSAARKARLRIFQAVLQASLIDCGLSCKEKF